MSDERYIVINGPHMGEFHQRYGGNPMLSLVAKGTAVETYRLSRFAASGDERDREWRVWAWCAGPKPTTAEFIDSLIKIAEAGV